MPPQPGLASREGCNPAVLDAPWIRMAIHEAGHAVAAVTLHGSVHSVGLQKTRCRVKTDDHLAWATVALAGPVAEAMIPYIPRLYASDFRSDLRDHLGQALRHTDPGALDDYAQSLDALERHQRRVGHRMLSPAHRLRRWEQVGMAAFKLLSARYTAVLDIAHALLDRDCLSGTEVLHLLSSYPSR